VRTFFVIFGFVALFVGAFIIFNMFNIVGVAAHPGAGVVPGARCEQAAGAHLAPDRIDRRGTHRGGLGFGFGVVLAIGLKALVGAIGLKLTRTSLAIEPRTIILSLVVGVG
jgi:putative ABC transport system permease protein